MPMTSREEGVTYLWVDGACSGNPGPMGIGLLIEDPRGQGMFEASIFLGHGTSMRAEWAAVAAGLLKADELLCRRLQIYSDSLLVVQQIKGVCYVNDPHLRVFHARVQKLIARFDVVELQHVRRQCNESANRLAQRAARHGYADASYLWFINEMEAL
jgi:ribonuclease HI